MRLREFSVERVLLGHHTKHWPRPMQIGASALVIFAGWYGLISSTFALVAGLRSLRGVWIWLRETIQEIYPKLLIILDGLHAFVEIWRIITRPLHELLFGWWPIDVPRSLVDIIVICSILSAGGLQAWIRSRPHRELIRIMDASLTLEGRIALVKRMAAAIDVIDRARDNDDQELLDRGQYELELALDEAAENVDDEQFVNQFERVLDLPPEEAQSELMSIAVAPHSYKAIWMQVFGRSATVSFVLILLVVFDAIWVHSHQ